MTPANAASGTVTPGSSSERATPPAISHLTRYGSGKTSGEEAEAGNHGGDAEVRRLVRDQLDDEQVAGLGALDEQRPGQRMAEAEVEIEDVRVCAAAGQLTVDPVAGDERHLLARCDRGDRGDVRVPAVVRRRGRDPHNSAATSSAA